MFGESIASGLKKILVLNYKEILVWVGDLLRRGTHDEPYGPTTWKKKLTL